MFLEQISNFGQLWAEREKKNVRYWPNADMSVNDPKRTLAPGGIAFFKHPQSLDATFLMSKPFYPLLGNKNVCPSVLIPAFFIFFKAERFFLPIADGMNPAIFDS